MPPMPGPTITPIDQAAGDGHDDEQEKEVQVVSLARRGHGRGAKFEWDIENLPRALCFTIHMMSTRTFYQQPSFKLR